MPSKNNGPQWEAMFDEAVALAATRHLGSTLSKIKRIRSWQRRQYGAANTLWHKAELFWLEGLILERARHVRRAEAIWTRLAELYLAETKTWGDKWFLPWCTPCASRSLGFAPNWYSVALQLRSVSGGVEDLRASLQRHARVDR